MLIKFMQKKIIEGITKEAMAKLPELKELALSYVKEHLDEILEEIKKKIVEIIKEKIRR